MARYGSTTTPMEDFADMDHSNGLKQVVDALLEHGPMRGVDLKRHVDPMVGRHLPFFLAWARFRDVVIAGPFEADGRYYQARQRR